MIIEDKKQDKALEICPKCGKEVPMRHQVLGYCPKCFTNLTTEFDEDGNRKVRFFVL